MNEPGRVPHRSAGRPPGRTRTEIPDDLIRALQEIVQQTPIEAITLREVAARAGTSPEMVRYYFKGKDGLLMAMLDRAFQRVETMLAAMREAVAKAGKGHTRLIIACLDVIYRGESAPGKLFNSKFEHDRWRDRETHWRERPDVVVKAVESVIADLVARGIYRSGLDTGQVAVLFMSLTGYPARLVDTLSASWISEARLTDPAWRDGVVEMAERYCLA